MADLVNEALTVLNQMELELKQLEQQKRGFAQIRIVLDGYKVALAEMAKFENAKLANNAEMTRLATNLKNETTRISEATVVMEADYAKREASVKGSMNKAVDDEKVVVKKLNATLLEGNQKVKALNDQIATLEDKLAKLTKSYNEFREKHALPV